MQVKHVGSFPVSLRFGNGYPLRLRYCLRSVFFLRYQLFLPCYGFSYRILVKLGEVSRAAHE